MKDKLDIGLLIEKTEQLVYDGHIEFAAKGEMPVQVFEADDGSKYQLTVSMTLLEDAQP